MIIDLLLFGALPYVAVALLLVISIRRYRKRLEQYTISSLSSQFLETKKLFWGSVPFHLGILFLFFGHLIGFLIPRQVMAFASHPLRLLVIELSGLVAGLMVLLGLVLLIYRRFSNQRLRQVTTFGDVAVYVVLLYQAITGLYIALFLRWGSAWYTQVAAPYLKSLFTFQPDLALIAGLPLWVKLHIAGAWVLFAVFAFTRLMHVLVAPIPYLWRPVQLVLWYRDRRSLRRV